MKTATTQWKRWLLGSVLAAAVLGFGYHGLRHYAWPAIKTWRTGRMNRDARAFLASGDLANALLTARKSLQTSTQNPEAWRLAAEAAEARQLPEAVSYQDSLCREEPTKENYLRLIRLALHFDVPGYVLGAIKTMPAEARDDPEFHRLAAQVYLRTGQSRTARFHLLALTQLQPADRVAQLDLAEIELAADPARNDRALRARVLALADEPGLRVRALTLLLRENVAGAVTAGTDELVSRLQLVPDLDVAGRLLVIQGLFFLGRPTAATALAKLQAEVVDQPAAAARVLDFLTRTGRAEKAGPWFATLPEATRQDEDVQLMAAEALLKLHDAPALETLLRGGNWPRREYLREALLAHSYRDQRRSADFAEAWKLALIGTGTDLGKNTLLLARADEWRWVNERHEVVWKLFAIVPDNESVQQILSTWERHQGNTANLNRLFARMTEVHPTAEVRNNFAYTSLLLDSNIARAGLIAAELAAAQPGNPYYATTYALALYKQGHPAEALARLDALTASERSEPVRMLLRALCLAATGQAVPASDLLNGVILTGMLPEEKHLAEIVTTEIAQLDRSKGNRSRLLAFHHDRPETGAGASGWLALVAPGTRGSATTDMQLADSFYAMPDWTGLQELLRATNWKNEDYLRAALLAYGFRRQDDWSQSREQWQQALALADRNPVRLENLRALVTEWKWRPERMETLNLLFERNTTDRRMLAELLAYYREAGRTPEMMRVLGLYLADSTDPTEEAVLHAYYSLLLGTNLAHAHVVARNAFEADPADPVRRMVYVFSLWKQQRAAEAMPLLAELKPGVTSEIVPIPLLRATIQAQLGATDAARASLARFNPVSALPEEAALAESISGQLAAQGETIKLPRT